MSREPLIAEDLQYPREGRPQIIVDWDSQTVTFRHCHEPRRFFSAGAESGRVCRFEEIRSIADFLMGEHTGTRTRAVLAAGKLVHNHTTAAEMASIFVSTTTGRTRVFAHWRNFGELRDALRSIAPQGGRPPLSEDPRMMPLFIAGIFAVVGAVIYFLL